MSGRLVRRVLQEREASPQDTAAEEGLVVVVEEEEDDEEAASPTRVAARNPFDLLDDDDDEPEEEKEDEAHTDQTVSYTEQKQSVKKKPNGAVPETNKKSKKKKKKGKAEPPVSTKSRVEKSLDSILEDLAIEKKPMQKSVHQNDRATGKEIETNETAVGTSSVIAIDPKHLKAENEMRRIFGSKVVDSLENQRNMPGTSRQVRGVRRAALNPRRQIQNFHGPGDSEFGSLPAYSTAAFTPGPGHLTTPQQPGLLRAVVPVHLPRGRVPGRVVWAVAQGDSGGEAGGEPQLLRGAVRPPGGGSGARVCGVRARRAMAPGRGAQEHRGLRRRGAAGAAQAAGQVG